MFHTINLTLTLNSAVFLQSILFMISTTLLDTSLAKIKHLPDKLKREIYKIPLLQTRQEKIYQDFLQEHAQYLPKLNNQEERIVQELKNHGTYVTSIVDLNLNTSNKTIESSLQLANRLKTLTIPPNDNSSAVDLGRNALLEYPEVYLWGLEEKLLDIIENYIGLPIIYQGCAMRKDIGNGKQVGIRRWHLDWEDRRLIKIIIYLNDVDENSGPYEYIDRQLTAKKTEILNHHNLGYLLDEQIAVAIPRDNWKSCPGEATTVIFSDPASVFHRAKPPITQDRIALTFCYTSCQPKVHWTPLNISQQQWQEIEGQINQRQKRCIGKTLKY